MTLAYDLMDLFKIQDVNFGKIRLGHPHDGGYVLLDKLCEGVEVVYSYGIGWDVSFEVAFANRYGSRIEMYDHTVYDIPMTQHPAYSGPPFSGGDEPPYRHGPVPGGIFHREGIGPSRTWKINTLTDHMLINNESSKKMILKMDVDGAEWEALNATPTATLKRFEQIGIELHQMTDPQLHQLQYDVLNRLTYYFHIYHVHLNNGAIPKMVDGIMMHDAIEVSFVRKDLVEAESTKQLFPTRYDGVNRTGKDELSLNYWPFLRR